MMGMGGVVAMRRNADYSSDYAFDFSEDNGGGHPDISDQVWAGMTSPYVTGVMTGC